MRRLESLPGSSLRRVTVSAVSLGAAARYLLATAAIALLLAWSAPANAADANLQWDANGTLPVGGAGTWDTNPSSLRWYDGSVYQAWSNTALDNAIFEGTAGIVTINNGAGGTVNAHNLIFNTTNYTVRQLNNNTLTLGGATPTISMVSGISATISSVIGGSAGLTKAGGGNLTLSGTNTYTGGTTINAGTLAISSDDNLGTASGGLTFNGGTLRSTASFTSNRGVTLNADGGTFNTTPTAGTLTLGGVITGDGRLTKTGAGTLTLTGNNTYLGGTTITGGTLAVSSDNNLGNPLGGLTLRGTLQFLTDDFNSNPSNRDVRTPSGNGIFDTNGHDATWNGTIDASGAEFHKIGAGALTLTGTNTYTQLQALEGTLILTGDNTPTFITPITPISNGARLQIGNGGASGTLAGNVDDNGVFAVNRSDAYTFSGVISGTGSFEQMGPGTTTLTANNTYSGGTTISAGVLQLGNGGATGSIVGDVVDNGTFAIDRSDTFMFGGLISGTGGFQQNGTGTTILTGASTYTGPTSVDAGKLVVNGSIVSPTTVENGGTLGGIGGLGAVTVLGGGIYAPGNSIGTQTVNGDFTLRAGAILEVEANAAGQSDRVIVKGTVNLTGSVLRVLAEAGNYAPSTRYIIIDNDGNDAVAGTFAQVATNLAFLTPMIAYDGGTGNDVVLWLIRNDFDFYAPAKTRNQRNVAHALEQFTLDSPLFLAVLNQTTEGARQAFDSLSGEVHATLPGVLADESRYVREAILGRLMQASYTNGTGQVASLGAGGPQVASLDPQAMTLGPDDKSLAPAPAYGPGIAFWTHAYGAWGDFDGNKNAATADRDLGGFVSGMDAMVSGSWRVGLAAGFSQSDINVDARYSAADVESFHLAGYAGGMAGPLALRGGGAWAWNDIDTSRAVIFPGFFEREKASYDADTGQVFGEIAYPMAAGRVALEPFAGLSYVQVDTDSFKERGELAALRGSGNDEDVTYSTLGLRAATTMQAWNMMVTPHVSAAWQHAFDDVTPGAALAFTSTGIGFGVTGVPLAEDSLLIEAGLDLNLSPTATLGVSYSGLLASDLQDNAVKGRLTWLF